MQYDQDILYALQVQADSKQKMAKLVCAIPVPRGGNPLYFVWYRRAAGIAPIFQVIYT